MFELLQDLLKCVIHVCDTVSSFLNYLPLYGEKKKQFHKQHQDIKTDDPRDPPYVTLIT